MQTIQSARMGFVHGVLTAAVVMWSLGCSDATSSSGTPSNQLYWRLALNHHAITVTDSAPYDTITMTATPLTVDGTPIQTTSPVLYTIRAPGVAVDNGVLRGTAPASQVWVIAALTTGGQTLRDSAVVNVTSHSDPIQTLKSLSIQPAVGDSAKVGVTLSYTINQQVLDVTDAPIGNPLVAYSSADTTMATVDAFGNVTTLQEGHVMLRGETTMYGVTKTDSLRLTVGLPVVGVEAIMSRSPLGSTHLESYFSPETLAVGVGGFVVWSNNSGQPVDLVFDNPSNVKAVSSSPSIYAMLIPFFYGDSAAADSGNIPAFMPPDSLAPGDGTGYRARFFPTAGSYPYHSTLYGTRGVILVKPE